MLTVCLSVSPRFLYMFTSSDFRQNYLLESSIWYEKTDPNDIKSSILWYEVFKWVDAETHVQSAIVGDTMREIEEKNEEEWQRFIKYDIKTEYEFDNVRE